jgi:MoaA/NifB/PqqE/SkfB family radical SAM enzyme
MRRKYLSLARRAFTRGKLMPALKIGVKAVFAPWSARIARPLMGPIQGTLIVTYRCNLKCPACLNLRPPGGKTSVSPELDTEGMKNLISELAQIGTLALGFTGGEPLLREDTLDLIRWARQLGMIVHLNTNGTLLDEPLIFRLLSTGVDSINVSLDGANSAVHDRMRGQAGAFNLTLAGTERLIRLGSRGKSRPVINLVMLVDETNIQEIPALVRLGEKLGVEGVGFIPAHDFKTVGRRELPEEFTRALRDLPRLGSRHRVIDNSPEYLAMFLNHFYGADPRGTCLAGYNSIVADCYGDIFPCVPASQRENPAANIRAGGLKSLWASDQSREIRKAARACPGCAWNCHRELDFLCRRLSLF